MTSYDEAIALTAAEQAHDEDGATREDIDAWFDSWVELHGEAIAKRATEIFLELF